jgi:hypothetical protein
MVGTSFGDTYQSPFYLRRGNPPLFDNPKGREGPKRAGMGKKEVAIKEEGAASGGFEQRSVSGET